MTVCLGTTVFHLNFMLFIYLNEFHCFYCTDLFVVYHTAYLPFELYISVRHKISSPTPTQARVMHVLSFLTRGLKLFFTKPEILSRSFSWCCQAASRGFSAVLEQTLCQYIASLNLFVVPKAEYCKYTFSVIVLFFWCTFLVCAWDFAHLIQV